MDHTCIWTQILFLRAIPQTCEHQLLLLQPETVITPLLSGGPPEDVASDFMSIYLVYGPTEEYKLL